MKQIPITVQCVFPESGEDVRKIILRSFLFYLRRALAAESSRTLAPVGCSRVS